MGYDRFQFEDLIRRVLESRPGLYSPSAVELLMGTAAQESGFGRYLRQKSGPALGAFQIEPATFEWLREKYGKSRVFWNTCHEELEWDLQLSILVARLRYFVVKEPLPQLGDVLGYAQYWKRHFNTQAGKGTVSGFVKNYRRYVL